MEQLQKFLIVNVKRSVQKNTFSGGGEGGQWKFVFESVQFRPLFFTIFMANYPFEKY